MTEKLDELKGVVSEEEFAQQDGSKDTKEKIGNEAEDDTLEEDFLLKAISAVHEGNLSDGDGIDDIDIDFDEGDCDALIHQEKSDDEQHPVYIIDENNQLRNQCTYELRGTKVKSENNDLANNSDHQNIDSIHAWNDNQNNDLQEKMKDEHSFGEYASKQEENPRSKFTIHYKPTGEIKTNTFANQANVRRHNFMCKCESCQVLYETYNEFIDSNNKAAVDDSKPGATPSKIRKEEETKTLSTSQGHTTLVHRCHTCGLILSTYKDYRLHLQTKHPRHWQTIQDFEEKRRIVMRKPTPKQVPSHGNFFKTELKKTTSNQFPPLSEVLTSTAVPQQPATSEAPVTYFYPMLYPVYFVMDKNQQGKGIQQVPSLPPGAPIMFPGAPFPTAAPVPQGASMTIAPPVTGSVTPPQGAPVVAKQPVPMMAPQVMPMVPPETASMSVNNKSVDKTTEKDQQYVCGNCGLTFSFKEHLVLHMRVHSDKPFKCESCGISFVNNVELKRHYRTHTFSIHCEHCNESFMSHDQLIEHENTRHNVNDTQGETRVDKIRINPISTDATKTLCKVCDSMFDSYQALEEHMMLHIHTGEAFPCYHCGISFTNNDSLSKHLKTHTKSPDTLEETIEEPGKVTMTVNKIHREPYAVKNDRPKKYYYCDVCGTNFVSMFSLNRHKRIHTGERSYGCEECGARFRTNSQRKAHILTHTGERPFKCHICPATFIQQGNLKRHIWTHTGEKPHVCDICGSGFLSTSDLKRHTRIHTGEKPYKCHFCTCSFTTSGNLKSHLKTHPEHSSVLEQVNGLVPREVLLSEAMSVVKAENPGVLSGGIKVKQEVVDDSYENIPLTMVKIEEDSS